MATWEPKSGTQSSGATGNSLKDKLSNLVAEKKLLQNACQELDRQCEFFMASRNDYRDQSNHLKKELNHVSTLLRNAEFEFARKTAEFQSEKTERLKLAENFEKLQQELRRLQNSEKNCDKCTGCTGLKSDLKVMELLQRLEITETLLGECRESHYSINERATKADEKITELTTIIEKLKNGLREAIEKAEAYKKGWASCHQSFQLVRNEALFNMRRKDEKLKKHYHEIARLQEQLSQKRRCFKQCLSRDDSTLGSFVFKHSDTMLSEERATAQFDVFIQRQEKHFTVPSKSVTIAENVPQRHTDKHHDSGTLKLSGWVNVKRSEQEIWTYAWCELSKGKLKFRTSFTDSASDILSIDLVQQKNEIALQDGEQMSRFQYMEDVDMSSVFGMDLSPNRTNGYTLLVDTGSQKSKEIWLNAVQLEIKA